MNNSSMMSAFAALCAAMVSASATAGVCKIGNTEYDTLQEAFNSKTSAGADFTVTLLQDIDVTSQISIPSFNRKYCTVDGSGHAIRQAYAGRMFSTGSEFTRIVFKNVTILGGGETYSTAADNTIPGVAFYLQKDACSLIFDTGCIISNFVYYSTLIGCETSGPKWNIHLKPGSVIACNRAAASPGLFRLQRWNDGNQLIIDGEIYGNTAVNCTIGWLDATLQRRTTPLLVINSGYIHDNVATSTTILDSDQYPNNTLFYLNGGPLDVSMTGGDIFNNDASAFFVQFEKCRILISGGKIYGNAGRAVHVYGAGSSVLEAVHLSGNAVVGGCGTSGDMGVFLRSESSGKKTRFALSGDFSGFAQLTGNGNPAHREVGYVYGTNLASYVGAENVHQSEKPYRVLQTDPTTGELKWREPGAAKIGSDEYATLAAAISAAEDGATVELLRDCQMTASIVPPANKSITIDGAGYSIFRSMKDPLVNASTAGGNMTFTNVELNEGFFTHRKSFTNHVDGVLVNTLDGVAATVTLGPGTILSGGRGTNALVRVANGATVNLDGCVITGAVNRAIAASAGGTLGVKGATIVKDNAGGDIDVANGNILSLNGDLTGSVHVTVAGAEAYNGQRFGTKTGDWSGAENFINGGDDPKLHVSDGGALVWCRRGFVITFR